MSLAAAAIAFLATFILMFALRPIATACGLMDVPGGRKSHSLPVPMIGGLAMSLGFAVAMFLLQQPIFSASTIVALCFLVVVGLIDDRIDLKAKTKLAAQTVAATIVVATGGLAVESLGSPFGVNWSLGPASLPFSVLFLVALINAFNIVDGLDGLGGGLALIAVVSLAVLSGGGAQTGVALALTAVIIAFLAFNLPSEWNQRVRAFMGDSGSMFLGLLIGILGIELTQGPAAELSPITGLWLVALPVYELLSSTARRLLGGRSPFAPDRQHLHHLLDAASETRADALLIMLAMAFLFACYGMLGHWLGIDDGLMLVQWLMAGLAYYQFARRPGILDRLARSPRVWRRRRSTRTI